MPLPDSRREYDRRMHRVMAHIERHIDQPLDLATLAGVAHFSPFHFHRLFNAWTGETLGDFVRRRRVEIAAQHMLLQPGLTVLAAALSVGFGSGEAFARAFKLRFGVSPTAWRAAQRNERGEWLSNSSQGERNFGRADGAPARHDGDSLQPHAEPLMNVMNSVTLIDRPNVLVAYLRHVGPYGDGVGRFWQQEFHPWRAKHGLQTQACYGIGHDDPAITDPAQCRYDACSELPEGFTVPRSMLTASIPAGRYAVMPFEGTSDTISGAWHSLMRDWLPDSGYQLDAKPCFEHYTARSKIDLATGVFSCDICIPVVPL